MDYLVGQAFAGETVRRRGIRGDLQTAPGGSTSHHRFPAHPTGRWSIDNALISELIHYYPSNSMSADGQVKRRRRKSISPLPFVNHAWITRESRVNHALTANWTAAVAASRDFHVPNWIELKDIVEIDRLTRTIGKLARKLGFFHEFS